MLRLTTPLVELDGDELAREAWQLVKHQIILRYIDVPIEYYDLSIQSRDESNDRVTRDAAMAVRQFGVGVKCPTITVTRQHMKDLNLKERWKAAGAIVSNAIAGTMFYETIRCANVRPRIAQWKRPIVVAKQAFADEFRALDFGVDRRGRLSIAFSADDGSDDRVIQVHRFRGSGIAMALYNTDDAMAAFAHACLSYGVEQKLDVFVATKSASLPAYDGRMQDVFEAIFNRFYRQRFEEAQLQFRHMEPSQMMHHAIESPGGFVWAIKNYDGDTVCEFVGGGFGSSSMMLSTLIASDGKAVLLEPAHGANPPHWAHSERLGGQSANLIASIFAWTRAITHIAKREGNEKVAKFAALIEAAAIGTVEEGRLTLDLAIAANPGREIAKEDYLSTDEMLSFITDRIEVMMTIGNNK